MAPAVGYSSLLLLVAIVSFLHLLPIRAYDDSRYAGVCAWKRNDGT